MVKSDLLNFLQPTSSYREMVLLEEIGSDIPVTQGALSRKAGIVPGMVNKYIKNFAADGLIEIEGNSTRNMRYALTDKGLKRKKELFILYLKETVALYKGAKEGVMRRLRDFYAEGIRRIVLYGAAETAELAYNAAEETGFQVVGIVDGSTKKQGKPFLGKIISAPMQIESFRPDAVIISSFGFQEQIYENIKELELNGIKVRKL